MASTISISINSNGLSLRAITNRAKNGKLERTNQSLVILCQTGCEVKKNVTQKYAIHSNLNRRGAIKSISFAAGISVFLQQMYNAKGADMTSPKKILCDATCEKELENVPLVTTQSGLQYKDIKEGNGPKPPVGYQVAANYVAMVPTGQVFDSSLDKGLPYIFRVGSDQVIKGLDEGVLSMKVGGKRRLYIPGQLAFPKGLTSAPGRPRVPPSSPVVFDVSLEYIPGLEYEEE